MTCSLPFGAHMASNAALAVAAVEAFLGGKPIAADVIAEALADVVAPGPAGDRPQLARGAARHLPQPARRPGDHEALTESFTLAPLIGVVAMMADKDVDGLLQIFADELTTVVCTTVAGTNRALSPEGLGERAAGIFGEERVRVAPNLADAIEVAVGLADEAGPGAGVLIAGSVIAAGQARALLVREESA